MATCPRCRGALTDTHRCPKGPLHWVVDAIFTAAVGGSVGASICYVLLDRPASFLVLSYAALGGVLAIAMRQALTPRSG